MRLKHAIALRVFIPAALLLLVTGVVVQSTATDRLTELNEQRYLSSIGILSESVREALLAQDLASLDEQLLALADSPDIQSALVTDLSGIVISSPDPRQLGKVADLSNPGWRTRTIAIAGQPQADLYVEFDLGQTAKALAQTQRYALGLVALTLVLLAGIAYWLGQSIAKRIERLSEAAADMANGDLGVRTGFTGAGEIALLGQAFDQMAARVQANLQEVSHSEQRTALALEAGNMGIWVYDTATSKAYMDGRLNELYGAPAVSGEFDLERLLATVHADDIEARASFIDQALVADRPIEMQFRVIYDNGEVRWIRSQANALFTSGQARIVGIDQDITQSVEQLQSIENLREELLRSNRELDDFAHIASHDLKEPLRGIANYAQFLKEDYSDQLDETANQYVDRMVALAQNLSDMIGDLLRMSRMTKIENDGKVSSIDKACQEIHESLQFTFEERGVVCNMAEGLGEVAIDSANLRELLRNMVVNGIKYNRSEPPKISLYFSDEAGAFVVEDNGIGIREDQLDDIFTPFRHLNPHDAFGRSTGLGMTIVKKIVENSGGKIWVESEVGVGTKMYFTLPRVL